MKHFLKNKNNTSVLLEPNLLYYTTLHLKLSSLFYSTQLVDIFSYELPLLKGNAGKRNKKESLNNLAKTPANTSSILVYNFHSIFFQQRFFIFLNQISYDFVKKNKTGFFSTNSVAELYPNANWLEREVSELHGVFFCGKKDLRNLMLQYGDTTAPMLKSFPSIGTREMFYDSVTDLLIQSPTTIQF